MRIAIRDRDADVVVGVMLYQEDVAPVSYRT
jgi:hypothetical protein